MQYEILDINRVQEWNELVTSFKQYDQYYLNGYVKGFSIHGDGTPLLIYLKN